ncbi:MAG: NAD(P)H-dependent oxidoreductase subunit E [Desulfobacterales bacterium]|nr:NAD(P)H-dependent oxidoreductase subunit E [Desulfobacterales bacterium]
MVEEQEFSAEDIASVDTIIERYARKPGALIPALEEIQEAIGYLPKSIQRRIAIGLRIPFSEVYGVITFYSFFTMVPKGRHTVRVCLGTACYVRGGKRNMEKLSGILGVGPGSTTDDRRFSLDTVRCIGACGLAPTMVIDNNTFKQVKPTKISDILEDYD